ncbi:MAG TPA: hypothetical protein VHX38_29415 [Pseudonocardiaceae bacterium]|nr:hypothetical protein [Pseudonocardiaceae bacterium]
MVARTVTALTRILDIVSIIQGDQRVQTVFTTDPTNTAIFRAGLDRFLVKLGVEVLPWEQATATRFDLAIAASENDRLDAIDAPILLVPHGLGYQKYYPNSRIVAGMNPDRLLREGRVLPTVIALSHRDQHTQLAAICPPASAHAVVIGDPSLDRLLAGRHRVHGYRAALDAAGKTLVVVSSTWGPHSLFGRFPRLPEELAGALPVDEYRVVVVLHPGVWSAHGQWQIRAWLGRAAELGLHVVPPTDNWQAVLCAAHCVVGDEGSFALYAAALDKPILLAAGTGANTVPGSPLALLAERATVLGPGADLADQIAAAISTHQPDAWAPAVRKAVQWPGRSARMLRPLLYELLDLAEPATEAVFAPAEVPTPTNHQVPTLVVGAREDGHILALQRFPRSHGDRRPEPFDHRHLVADLDRASYRELSSASILRIGGDADGPELFSTEADAMLAQWPNAELIATRAGRAELLVRTRHELLSVRAPQPPPGFDPMLLASAAFVRHAQGRGLVGVDKLRVGARVIAMVSAAVG